MMKKFIITILLLASIPSLAQMVPQWKNVFGIPDYSAGYPKGMVTDSLGNTYMAEDVVNYNTGENTCHDPIIRKINSNGITEWYKNLAGVACQDEAAFIIKLHKNSLYISYSRIDTTLSLKTYCISKISKEGNILWRTITGTSYSYSTIGHEIIFDDNNIYTCGQTNGKIYKLNDSGNIVDSIHVMVNNIDSYVYSFKFLPQGRMYLISYTIENNIYKYYLSLRNADGTIAWSKLINGELPRLLHGNDNSIYEYHYRYETLVGYFVSINKYSHAGTLLWTQESLAEREISNNNKYNRYPLLSLSSDGNLILGVTSAINLFSYQSTAIIKKLNSQTGDSLWTFNPWNTNSLQGQFGNFTQDASGNIYAAYSALTTNWINGDSYSIVKLNSDGMLLRTTANNNFLNRRFNPSFIQILQDNSLIINGYYDGHVTFYEQSATIKFSQPVIITPNQNSLPNNFSLSQNYPNPFNPITVISFQLPVAGFTTLKVFDINGKEISDLVNENLSVGEYKINFDASALPSGVYYYKLTSGNFSETKKMILIK